MVEKDYLLECSILNAYIVDSCIHTVEYAQVGKQMRDMLQFRQELVDQLICSFCSRQRIGRPLHVEHECLNPSLGHYPEFHEQRGRCVLCLAKGARHETFATCEHCGVHLCVCPGETVSRCITPKLITSTNGFCQCLEVSSVLLLLNLHFSCLFYFQIYLAFRYFISSSTARPPRGA